MATVLRGTDLKDVEIHYAAKACALGFVLVARREKGICAILFGDTPEALHDDLRRRFPQARLIAAGREFAALTDKVVAFVEKPTVGLDLPLDIEGTAFQKRVWRALCRIPAGSTASYAEIAKKIGAPKAVRAVANACAANAIAVAIPCHRILRSDGALSGYRGGVGRKRFLLEREKAELEHRTQKWKPVLGKIRGSNKMLERRTDSS